MRIGISSASECVTSKTTGAVSVSDLFLMTVAEWSLPCLGENRSSISIAIRPSPSIFSRPALSLPRLFHATISSGIFVVAFRLTSAASSTSAHRPISYVSPSVS